MLKTGRVSFLKSVRIVLIASVLFIGQFSFAGTAFVYDVNETEKVDISLYKDPLQKSDYIQPPGGYVKNVIVCIGDGMGLGQVALARIKSAGLDGKLFMERMPVCGLVYTHSSSSAVTDSAAGATALACGVKTNNGRTGMTPDKASYLNIVEAVKLKGFRTGMVVTSTTTHGTPAGYGSHVESRSNESEIASQFLEKKIDIMLGGGRKYWLSNPDEGGVRKDGRDLIEEAVAAGYTFVDTRDELLGIEEGPVLGLFQSGSMTTVEPEPMLPEMTAKAIELLNKKRDGWFSWRPRFFLMMEGSQIDWVCHAHNEQECVKQMLLFDLAVREAVEFAKKDKRTLVLVTADHETGGLALEADSEDKNDVKSRWASKSHTGVAVPMYAYGPGAENFGGIYDNTEIAIRLARLLGIKEFPKEIDISSPEAMSAK